MSSMKAVILDAISMGSDLDFSALENAVSEFVRFEETVTDEIISRIGDADIVIVNKVVIDRAIMEQCPNLKLITLTATGTNNIDLEAAKDNQIRVCNVIQYGRSTLVQHTFCLILALSQNLLAFIDDVKKGAWNQSPSFCLMGHPIRELDGKTLGIIGYGDLGQGVANLGKAFGMNVLVANLPGRESSQTDVTAEPNSIVRVPLNMLLATSDVISLHCLLSDSTRHLISHQEFEIMKPEAILINTARGGLVDEEALVAALLKGKIAGAATDVLSQEPPVHGNPLLDLDLPNLIITPHCAWTSQEARQRLLDKTADNIKDFIHQHPQRFVV